jgi:hypothetical protein
MPESDQVRPWAAVLGEADLVAGLHVCAFRIDAAFETAAQVLIGVAAPALDLTEPHVSPHCWGIRSFSGGARHEGLERPFTSPLRKGDVVLVSVDMDAPRRPLSVWVNGVPMGVAFTRLPSSLRWCVGLRAFSGAAAGATILPFE